MYKFNLEKEYHNLRVQYDQLFDQGSAAIAENVELRRQLAAANERAGRLEANLRSLCERLDEWWYEADPMGDVKKGERHPWTVAARKALEVPDAL